MQTNLKKIIRYLSDGQFHSGAGLGKRLGMTRSGVWKYIGQFPELDIEIEAAHAKGYRIPQGLSLLKLPAIKKHVSKHTLSLLKKIILLDIIDSTNDYLLQLARKNTDNIYICLAEQQIASKARHGRSWLSPFAANILLSVLWPFRQDVSSLSGLSLSVATIVVEVLEELGIKNDLGLKWPNDILWQGKKLAGILVEIIAESHDICNVIIGVGFNVNMPTKFAKKIDRPWIDLATITNKFCDRNKIAGLLIDQLIIGLNKFETVGFAGFADKWQQYDVLLNKKVRVILFDKVIKGTMRGIDKNGYLLLEDRTGKLQTFSAGEVSIGF